VTHRAIARRYANALYDVLRKAGNLGRARQDLEAFADLVKGHDELVQVFENPAVPPLKKRAVVAALLERAPGVTAEVRRLLLMLGEQDRLAALDEISGMFAERVMAESRTMPAEVVTAEPLTDASRAALAAALGRATGSEITINERVDPAIVGGVVARVGSLVFDGSVSRRLEKMRQRMMAEV